YSWGARVTEAAGCVSCTRRAVRLPRLMVLTVQAPLTKSKPGFTPSAIETLLVAVELVGFHWNFATPSSSVVCDCGPVPDAGGCSHEKLPSLMSIDAVNSQPASALKSPSPKSTSLVTVTDVWQSSRTIWRSAWAS